MELLQRIKADQLKARKDRDKIRASLLTTLIGEADLQASKPKGMDILSLVKKFIKDINTSLKAGESEILEQEKGILEGYLPAQMTEVQLRAFFLESSSSLGEGMKRLKMTHPGQYDGRLASTVAKEIFS